LPMGLAFRRAGFESRAHDAPSNLFNLPRVQDRARAILEARRSQGAVSLPEVTDMLKRVFAGAHSEGEYSAAHNAAFSLARLYGHVTDRASIEVIRRPSRDPDAPSEQALASWVEALPALAGPGPEASGPLASPTFLRVADAPAAPLGREPEGPSPEIPNEINGLVAIEPSAGPGPSGPEPELSSEIDRLNRGTTVAGRPENGAPSGPVTGTPDRGARTELLGGPGPHEQKGAPLPERQVPGTTGAEWPKWEDLF
jgi:hypothetical protein